jgi:hypothetical protein
VIVKVLAIGSSGTFAPKGAANLSVPAASVGTLDVSSAFDGKPIAPKLLSESPVNTVRSVVQGDQTYGQVATGFAGSSQMGLPLGAQSKVIVSSLGRSGQLQVQAFDQTRQALGEPISRTVDAGTTLATTCLPAGAAAVKVSGDSPNLVSGLFALHGKGASSGAFQPPAEVSGRPRVLPGW